MQHDDLIKEQLRLFEKRFRRVTFWSWPAARAYGLNIWSRRRGA